MASCRREIQFGSAVRALDPDQPVDGGTSLGQCHSYVADLGLVSERDAVMRRDRLGPEV